MFYTNLSCAFPSSSSFSSCFQLLLLNAVYFIFRCMKNEKHWHVYVMLTMPTGITSNRRWRRRQRLRLKTTFSLREFTWMCIVYRNLLKLRQTNWTEQNINRLRAKTDTLTVNETANKCTRCEQESECENSKVIALYCVKTR